MSKKKKEQKSLAEVIFVDVGGSFVTSLQFSGEKKSGKLSAIERSIVSKEGVWPTGEGGDQPSFDLRSLWSIGKSDVQNVDNLVVSTSRRQPLKILLVGPKEADLQEFLDFSKRVGVDVIGTLTQDGIAWSHENTGMDDVDAILLIGGFQRHKTDHLLTLAEKLANYISFSRHGSLPIFFIGAQELKNRIKTCFSDDQIIEFVPELWPDKEVKNFLSLFLDFEQLAMDKAVSDDWVLKYLKEENQVELQSGYNSILSAVSLCSQFWKDNVLYIELGSQRGLAVWGHYLDHLTEVNWDRLKQEKHLFSVEDYRGTLYLGMQVLENIGLGQGLQNGVKEFGLLDRVSIKDSHYENDSVLLHDKVFNTMLYSDVVFTANDMKWQSDFLVAFLKKVWKSLPPSYNPRHIILGGGGFENISLDALLESVFLPARLPYTAEIWRSKAASFSLLGLLPHYEHLVLDEHLESYFFEHICSHARMQGRVGRKALMSQVVVDPGAGDVHEYDVLEGDVTQIEIEDQRQALVRFQPTTKAQLKGWLPGQEVVLRTSGGARGIIIDTRR